MNWLRITLHLFAVTALALIAAVAGWLGWHTWVRNNKPSPAVGISRGPDPNLAAVQIGVQVYYKVYGRWPANWKDVRKSLLFQRDLASLDKHQKLIDPDDGKIDFPSDIVYKPGTVPQLLSSVGGRQQIFSLKPPTTYSQFLPAIEKSLNQPMTASFELAKKNPAAAFSAKDFLSDDTRLIQLGILSQLYALSSMNLHPRATPYVDVKTLIRHPSSPIDNKSINPVTGKPFKFDGTANDVLVLNTGGGPMTFMPILEDGHHPTYYFTP